MSKTLTERRLLVGPGLTFVATALGARVAFKLVPLAPRVAALVAALPVAAFAWFITTAVRLVRGLDELEQRIQLEALAVAYPSAILMVYAVGLLEAAGIVLPGFVNLRDQWPLVVLPYFVGLWIVGRRYR